MPFSTAFKGLILLACLNAVSLRPVWAGDVHSSDQVETSPTRVRLIGEQELRGYVPDQPFAFHFSLSETTLTQRLIFNLENALALADVEVRLNGVRQFFQAPPKAQTVSFALSQGQLGDNLLEIILHHPSHAQIFLDSYPVPESVAALSASELQRWQQAQPFATGSVQLNFLPGMAIELRPQGAGFVFRDANGTSLTRLNHALKHLRVTASAEISSLSEADRFVLQVDPRLNLWAVIDQLQTLPYFVQVRPVASGSQTHS
ncbi:MAG: hypothetical protein ACO1RX_06665 [Candidatus Sericytochromatia bacterium]